MKEMNNSGENKTNDNKYNPLNGDKLRELLKSSKGIG